MIVLFALLSFDGPQSVVLTALLLSCEMPRQLIVGTKVPSDELRER